jgi:hypothetical protein
VREIFLKIWNLAIRVNFTILLERVQSVLNMEKDNTDCCVVGRFSVTLKLTAFYLKLVAGNPYFSGESFNVIELL